MQELEGRVALVTGGGSGIGRGIAVALAGAGVRVVVADIERDAADAVAAEIAASGGEASGEALDVTDPAAIEALAGRCYEQQGGVDVLCNNAGVLGPTPIGPDSIENWRWILDVNLFGVVHGISAYVASKFAVVSMSRNLRGELAGSGIGVSVLCPGAVRTGIWQAGRNRPAERGGPEEYEWPDRLFRDSSIDPLAIGRHVLRAIREDEFYIITHTDRRHVIESEARELLDAFDRSDRDPLD